MRELLFIGAWTVFMATVACADCPIGYHPAAVAFRVAEDDISRMELSVQDREAVQAKIVDLKSREDALRQEFRDKAAALATSLAARLPNRQEADAYSVRLEDILKELDELRVNYTLDMLETLKSGNLRHVRSRPVRQDSRCEGAVSFTSYRYALTSKAKELIGLTEDEGKYLKEFDAREAYFRVEQRDLGRKLDSLLNAKDIDRAAVAATLEQLAVSVRERTTNRLDRYFYADKVLFSPDREERLVSYLEKQERRHPTANPVQNAHPARASSPGTKKKWYWPL
jgi:Spy/CpxP family protein refolding chaperone